PGERPAVDTAGAPVGQANEESGADGDGTASWGKAVADRLAQAMPLYVWPDEEFAQPNPTLNRGVRLGRDTADAALLEAPAVQQAAGVPDFRATDPWRVLRITGEFVDGFDALAQVGPAVSIFGSARTPRDHTQYQAAQRLARRLAEEGFAIITGG